MSDASLDAYSRRLRVAHEAAVTEQAWANGPRRLISASWRRSMDAGIDPETRAAPQVYDESSMSDVRGAHPLRPLLPLLADTLRQVADETAHIMIVTDALGRILWRDGNHAMMCAADRVGLSDGFQWSERAVGTNGIGTALATRRPVHVYSEEHLVRVLHVWSCSGAPIIDPDTDTVLGCIDISGTSPTLHPATVALVGAAARLAETQLALRMHERDERLRRGYDQLRNRPGALVTATGRVIAGDPGGILGTRIHVPGIGDLVTLPDGRAGRLEPFLDGFLLRASSGEGVASPLNLTLLGNDQPAAQAGDVHVQLSLRHAEILALLALNPPGLTAEQLSFHLYGDHGNPVTIRAEIHRLRAQLGGAIAAKPYRLTVPVEADFLELRRLLTAGSPAALARAYPGPLLPRSESPEIRRERDELEVQVRARLLLHGSPDDLWTYAQTSNGRTDFQILERVATALPPADHRAAAARTRLAQ